MKFAVGYFPTDDGIDPATLARMVEERPFESLFFADHTHIPPSPEPPYPGGAQLPRDAVPGGDRAAARVLAHPRSVRRPDGGRRGHRAHQARDRHLPGDRARSD